MSSHYRHKTAWKEKHGYGRGLDAISGELYDDDLDVYGADDSTAMLLAKGLGELSQTGVSMYEKSESDKKTKASSKEADDAAKVAVDVRRKAQLAAADALAETDANGPLHKAAASLDTAAKVAEAKAAVLRGGGAPDASAAMAKKDHGKPSSGVPTWVWVGGGVAGAGVLGLVLYKLLKR